MEDKTIELLGRCLDGDFRVSPMAPDQTTKTDVIEIEKIFG